MKRGKTEWEYPMPEELNSPGAEYTPLPDEFMQGGGEKTNEPEKKRNRRMCRMYGMTAAFVLAGWTARRLRKTRRDKKRMKAPAHQITPARRTTPMHQVIPEP